MGKELNAVLNSEIEQFSTYQNAYDEMFKTWADFKSIRPHYQYFSDWLRHKKPSFLEEKQALADLMFKKVGITFSVYNEEADSESEDESESESKNQSQVNSKSAFGSSKNDVIKPQAQQKSQQQVERTIPFDVLPRILSAQDWSLLEKGIKQRILALNMFLHDVYHQQHILKNNPTLAHLVLKNKQYHPEMQGIDLPKKVYSHVSGVDIIRDHHGQFLVLEDNLRVPSGVSYMLENRRMMMRLFPELFNTQNSIMPIAHYPDMLRQTLLSVAPMHAINKPVMVVLTPGAFNSAYFEHAFLAQQLGAELVEGKDLLVRDLFVYMRTTEGLKKVDIIYRRIDDDYLDPIALNPRTHIGVAGLMMAYRLGHVNIINAIGTGVADDKSIYPFVPDMIRFYLDQEPILENVKTYHCFDDKEREYVLKNLNQLVVKEVHGAGGYGMLIGPAATQAELQIFRDKIKSNPSNYIAQPTLSLSTNPTLVEQGIAPRHIDLRPFVLSGEDIHVVPGGLTRVALKEGSLVVNSSQGGGTKDTWVLAD